MEGQILRDNEYLKEEDEIVRVRHHRIKVRTTYKVMRLPDGKETKNWLYKIETLLPD